MAASLMTAEPIVEPVAASDAAFMPPTEPARPDIDTAGPTVPALSGPSALWSIVTVFCISLMAVPLIWIVRHWITHD